MTMKPVAESDDTSVKLADFSQISASAGYKERSPSMFVRQEGPIAHVLLRNQDGSWTHLQHRAGAKGWVVSRGKNWADLFRHVSEFHRLEW